MLMYFYLRQLNSLGATAVFFDNAKYFFHVASSQKNMLVK